MKIKKASRRLDEIEAMLVEVIEEYHHATPAQHQEMDHIKAAITHLKTGLLAAKDQEVKEPPSQPVRKKPKPPSKKTGKRSD